MVVSEVITPVPYHCFLSTLIAVSYSYCYKHGYLLLPSNSRLSIVIFVRRLKADTKKLDLCKSKFQMVLLRLNTRLYLLECTFGKKGNKSTILMSLQFRSGYRTVDG